MATGSGYMDLTTARQISRRPGSYRADRLIRALSLLMRWADEPCTEGEYWRRIAAARRIYNEIGFLIYTMEKKARKKYRPAKTEPSTSFSIGRGRGLSAIVVRGTNSGSRRKGRKGSRDVAPTLRSALGETLSRYSNGEETGRDR